MKYLIALISVFAATLSTAHAATGKPIAPFSDCSVQSGPQTLADSLKIPNDILQANVHSSGKPLEEGGSIAVWFNLKYDAKTQVISISEDQSFDDWAKNESEVFVQLGAYGSGVYGSIETFYGSSYTRFNPNVSASAKGAEVYLQHVNHGEGKYADLRITCYYK